MPEGASHGGKRNPGVATGRFDDRITRSNAPLLVGAPQNVERHPILDAPGQVEMLALRMDDAAATVKSELDREQRRVAHQSGESAEAFASDGKIMARQQTRRQ
jgi:hypothetical protein